MTVRLSSSSISYAVSKSTRIHAASLRTAGFVAVIDISQAHRRQYAQKQKPPQESKPAPRVVSNTVYDVRAALNLVASEQGSDPVNPPLSTLPAPLTLPTRGPENAAVYWYRIGRTYASFYKDGIKSVWFNNKASRLLRERLRKEQGGNRGNIVNDAVAKNALTRAEFQVLARNNHDIGKLPLFAVLALVFGEWLPLIVPFIPSAVPGTARIPKQVQGMRLKAEERRRISFRQNVAEPTGAQLPSGEEVAGTSVAQGKKTKTNGKGTAAAAAETALWPVAFNDSHRTRVLADLRADQLFHISATLNLHSRLWDRVQLHPPAALLRRAAGRHLQYLAQDDGLLLRKGGAGSLSPVELGIACEERGLDVLGIPDGQLRRRLDDWLMRQKQDGGSGRALLLMLFRRPTKWQSSLHH